MADDNSSVNVSRILRKVQRLLRQNKIQSAWDSLDAIDEKLLEECSTQLRNETAAIRQRLLIIMVRELKEK